MSSALPRASRAPLHLCALTLLPHRLPVAAPDGTIFDSSCIVQLVRRSGLHPLLGTPLHASQLVPLRFAFDPNGIPRCPLLGRHFLQSEKVVALATTGRVFSYEAVARGNLSTGDLRDLVDGTPFELKDLLILYDPDRHVWTAAPASAPSAAVATQPRPSPPNLQPIPHAAPLQPLHTVPQPASRQPLPPPPRFLAPQPLHPRPVSALHPPPASSSSCLHTPSFSPAPLSLRKPVPRPTISAQALAGVHRSVSKCLLYHPSPASVPSPPPVHVPPRAEQTTLAAIPPSPAAVAPHAMPKSVPRSQEQRYEPAGTSKPSRRSCGRPARRRTGRATGTVVAPAPPLKKPRRATRGRPPGTTAVAAAASVRAAAAQMNPAGAECLRRDMNALYKRRQVEDERKAVYKKIRKGRKGKGYVRVVTNIGHLNIELHCDKVPITCDNFLQLAERKYYDGLPWHRVVPGFIAQTGDPTGYGDSGDSAWGGYVKDEIRTSLNHDAPGVVSMASSGRDTNRSQWFVCFEAARHLDGAHTVFGKVVGGLFVLKKMESEAEMGHPLSVERIEVLVNPIRQIREAMQGTQAPTSILQKPLPAIESPATGQQQGTGMSSQTSTLTDGIVSNQSFDDEQGNTMSAKRVSPPILGKRRPTPASSLSQIMSPGLPSARSLLSSTSREREDRRFQAPAMTR